MSTQSRAVVLSVLDHIQYDDVLQVNAQCMENFPLYQFCSSFANTTFCDEDTFLLNCATNSMCIRHFPTVPAVSKCFTVLVTFTHSHTQSNDCHCLTSIGRYLGRSGLKDTSTFGQGKMGNNQQSHLEEIDLKYFTLTNNISMIHAYKFFC